MRRWPRQARRNRASDSERLGIGVVFPAYWQGFESDGGLPEGEGRQPCRAGEVAVVDGQGQGGRELSLSKQAGKSTPNVSWRVCKRILTTSKQKGNECPAAGSQPSPQPGKQAGCILDDRQGGGQRRRPPGSARRHSAACLQHSAKDPAAASRELRDGGPVRSRGHSIPIPASSHLNVRSYSGCQKSLTL